MLNDYLVRRLPRHQQRTLPWPHGHSCHCHRLHNICHSGRELRHCPRRQCAEQLVRRASHGCHDHCHRACLLQGDVTFDLSIPIINFTLLFKIAHLEVNPHPISMLDDLLLFICIPSFFLYTFFKIAPEASGYMTARPETLFSTILVVRRVKFYEIISFW